MTENNFTSFPLSIPSGLVNPDKERVYNVGSIRVLIRSLLLFTPKVHLEVLNLIEKLARYGPFNLENLTSAGCVELVLETIHPFLSSSSLLLSHSLKIIEVSLGERSWPPAAGYSFVCWFQMKNFLKTPAKETEPTISGFSKMKTGLNGQHHDHSLSFSGLELEEGQWHHLAIVHSKLNALAGLFQPSIAYLYFDGKLMQTGRLGYSPSPIGKPLQVTIGTPVTTGKVGDIEGFSKMQIFSVLSPTRLAGVNLYGGCSSIWDTLHAQSGIPRFGRLRGDINICRQCVIGDTIRSVGGMSVILALVEAVETSDMLHMALSFLSCALHHNPQNIKDMQTYRGYHLLALFLRQRMPSFDMQCLEILLQIAACEASFSEPRKLECIQTFASPIETIRETSFEDLNFPKFHDKTPGGTQFDMDDFSSLKDSFSHTSDPENADMPVETSNCIVLSSVDMVEQVLLDWTLWVTAPVSIQIALLNFLEQLASHRYRNHNLTVLRKINLVRHLLVTLQRGDVEVPVLEKLVAILGVILKEGFLASELEYVVKFVIMSFDPPEAEHAVNSCLPHWKKFQIAAELVEENADMIDELQGEALMHKTYGARLMGGDAFSPATTTSILRFMVDLAKMCPTFSIVWSNSEDARERSKEKEEKNLTDCDDPSSLSTPSIFLVEEEQSATTSISDGSFSQGQLSSTYDRMLPSNFNGDRVSQVPSTSSTNVVIHHSIKDNLAIHPLDQQFSVPVSSPDSSPNHHEFKNLMESSMSSVYIDQSYDSKSGSLVPNSTNTTFSVIPKLLLEMDDSGYGGGPCSAGAALMLDFIAEVLADLSTEQIKAAQFVENILEMVPLHVGTESTLVFQGLFLSRLMNFNEMHLLHDDEEDEKKLDKIKWSSNLDALCWMIVDRVTWELSPNLLNLTIDVVKYLLVHRKVALEDLLVSKLNKGKRINGPYRNRRKLECCKVRINSIQNVLDGELELGEMELSKVKHGDGPDVSDSKSIFNLLNDIQLYDEPLYIGPDELKDFVKEEGLKKAIANVNGIWLDGKKISVGVAKYQKQKLRQAVRSNVRRDEDSLIKGGYRSRRVGSEYFSRLRDERLYKDAVVSFDGQNEDLEIVVKGLASDGIKVKRAKWGYAWNSCILTFGSMEEFEEVWSSRREEVAFWFDWLDPLMSGEGVPMAFCSVELIGMPLLCWNASFMEKMVSRWGKLVCIHESTARREDLAVARVLLRVASPFDSRKLLHWVHMGDSLRDKASSEEKEESFYDGVGSKKLCAEDYRDTVDRWLVGENCTTMAGSKGSQHLMLEDGEGQTRGLKMSDFSKEDLNFKGDYRGLGLRNTPLNDCDKAQLEDLRVRVEILGEHHQSGSIEHFMQNEGRSMGVEEEGGSSHISAGDHLQSSRNVKGAATICQSGSVARNENRRERRLLTREALDVRYCKKEKSRAIANMVKRLKPCLLVIQETKLEFCSQSLRRRIGENTLNGGSFAPAVGSAGGLMVLWNDKEFEVSNSHLNGRFIAVYGKFKNSREECVIINVYGPSIDSEEAKFFRELLVFVSAQTCQSALGINDLEVIAQGGVISQQEWNQLMQSRTVLWRLYRTEESIWFQKSRAKWIKDADINTKFFHLLVLNRIKRNEITSLKINDSIVSDPQSIKSPIVDFFKKAYNSKFTMEVDDLSLDFAKMTGVQSSKLEKQFLE
ncbi:hypothetical protein F3Y22_tig00003096pilonHSYRG00052 [Hibiscus syriacus]|uniref:Uncharacterized protein n=1 Tax=Hibiscus syriacus TaxID=106335 RepID=A0A6A3CRR9_HIBSY|nr:hypothetical protein F3Y22_tig00003096pilonHSYRG00052 [Hibiscus syriacus]